MTGEDKLREAAAALRALAADGRLPRADLPYGEVLRRPAELIGAFDSLPPEARECLCRYFAEEEDVRTLAEGPLSRRLLAPGVALTRALYAIEHLVGLAAKNDGGRVRQAQQVLRRAARGSSHASIALRRALHSLEARVQSSLGRNDLATILRAQGFDPRPLGYGYLERLPPPRGRESVLLTSRTTHAQLIGVDLIRSAGVCWFLEANCNPVLMDARLALHEPGRDPWVNNMLAAAKARGRKRLIVYGYRPFARGHARALVEAGQRQGIAVDVIDDIFSSAHAGHRRAWLMDDRLNEDAFVVRAKAFDVLFDRSVLSKDLTRDIVGKSLSPEDRRRVRLPALLQPGAEAPNYSAGLRYPNIVAKRDFLDRGMGVSFYKLPRIPDASQLQADFFEEYRVPDPVGSTVVRGRESAVPESDERAWKLRVYALLTPHGVEYLSTIKVICGKPVPPKLADGKVVPANLYLATINEGGFYSAVTAAEDEEYTAATKIVGEALLAWLDRKYAVPESRGTLLDPSVCGRK